MKLAGIRPFSAGRTIINAPNRSLPIQTNGTETLPLDFDVVVIGAGIAGLTAALHLNEEGLRVAVCEKGRVAAEQTSRSMGWVSSLGDLPERFELSAASKNLWPQYSARWQVDTSYRAAGLMLACYTEQEVAEFETWIKAHDQRTDARILSRTEIETRLSAPVPANVEAAVFQASDGSVEPEKVGVGLASAAMRAGVQLFQDCAVRGLETTAGRVSVVSTELGPIRTSTVMVAAGAWSRQFCRSLDINVPTLTVHSALARTSRVPDGPLGCGAVSEGSWRRTADGHYVIGKNTAVQSLVMDSFRLAKYFLPHLKDAGNKVALELNVDFFKSFRTPRKWRLDEVSPFEQCRILGSEPDATESHRILQALAAVVPGFSSATIEATWGGAIDVSPDQIPIVSAVDTLPGLYLCTGFSAHGLAMAPAAGKLVASLIAGRTAELDHRPYQLNRFSS